MEPKTYKNGQIIQQMRGDLLTYYYKNGTVKAEGRFVDGLMEGEWKFYRETGQLWQIGNFLGSTKHGPWVRYDRSGQVEYQEEFQNNKIVRKK